MKRKDLIQRLPNFILLILILIPIGLSFATIHNYLTLHISSFYVQFILAIWYLIYLFVFIILSDKLDNNE